jgi:Fic family protein
MTVLYERPISWLAYDAAAISRELTEAKVALLALTRIPYQRSWADELQKVQLKREVAGTSRIEGAEFTDQELEDAMKETPEQLETRSQKQAAAAVATYRWIATLPMDRPVDISLIIEVHRRMVTGCDDDHCAPGQMRASDQNVTFGSPRHRGVEGGQECSRIMTLLAEAVRSEFLAHDPLVQALGLHYHFAAAHPFLDGNGRTARALEAIMLRRIGLRDTLFIAMSNYYYEEKSGYLTALNSTRAANHDLTNFLKFALVGVEKQCRRLFDQIRKELQKALYRNTYTDLFGRMHSPRKRVVSERHVKILQFMSSVDEISLSKLSEKIQYIYSLKNSYKALIRDLNYLLQMKAIFAQKNAEGYTLKINIDWPTQITETEFFQKTKALPKAKVHGFLSA